MSIGSFDDFMRTIKPDYIEQIAEDANEKATAILSNMGPSNPGLLGTQVGVISYTIAIELLGLYHKWLEQQL